MSINVSHLITGRTHEQGRGLHEGKDSEAYRRATTLVEMNADDLARLGVAEGETVKIRTKNGQAEASVRVGDLPPGMIFIPMGPMANALIGVETESTGMPIFKGLTAEVEPV